MRQVTRWEVKQSITWSGDVRGGAGFTCVCVDMCERQGNGMILGRRRRKKNENRKYSRVRGTGRTKF